MWSLAGSDAEAEPAVQIVLRRITAEALSWLLHQAPPGTRRDLENRFGMGAAGDLGGADCGGPDLAGE
jgi:hypothetical protein